MAVYELPLRSDVTHFDFVLSLDGTSYLFTFQWNFRASAWYFFLSLEDGTPIWMGVKVVVAWPLGQRSRHENRPPGFFQAFDATPRQEDPGLTDLGQRVRILYFDKSELAAINAQLSAG